MPSPVPGNHQTSHADNAARAASMGAFMGAVKWGLISAVGAAGAYAVSPLFRGLTLQFKVYLWMCPTTIGSMVEADYRLRQYEAKVRAQHRERIEAARELQLAEELAEIEEMERRARDSARAGMERS